MITEGVGGGVSCLNKIVLTSCIRINSLCQNYVKEVKNSFDFDGIIRFDHFH